MQVEVGAILEGKVTGLTNFGAFVTLADGSTGMVHISEVSNSYVKEIRDHLTENQEVKVKVLNIGADGKISLSIKQASTDPQPRPQQRRPQQSRPNVWTGPKPSAPSQSGDSFEDMMAKFKQVSDEKISDLKRSNDTRYSQSYSRRGSNK